MPGSCWDWWWYAVGERRRAPRTSGEISFLRRTAWNLSLIQTSPVSRQGRRMPYTRMFKTVTSSILHRAPPEMTSDEAVNEEDEESLSELVASIINKRLRKLEGLRTGIRRLPLARRTLKTAPHAEATRSDLTQNDTRSPITRLNSHQNFIMGKMCMERLPYRIDIWSPRRLIRVYGVIWLLPRQMWLCDSAASMRIATQVLLAILTSGDMLQFQVRQMRCRELTML